MKYMIESPYLVSFKGNFSMKSAPTSPPNAAPDRKECKKRLNKYVEQMDVYQRVMYAHDHHAILLVFQAMDAAGKDSTIRAVTRGLNPAGCQVHSFKKPSAEELDHDFLWRTTRQLPERGRIGGFNRSYYEEVLVVRVHPDYLDSQQLPFNYQLDKTSINGVSNNLWQQRFRSINDHEHHLASNGMIIRKFFLNVSREEQHRRFKDRIDTPRKNWKFSPGDLAESQQWDDYMKAYQDCLRSTSTPWAPWYCIPADNKPAMRAAVSTIVLNTLQELKLEYPSLDEDTANKLDTYRSQLLV